MFPKIMVPPNHQLLIGISIINHPFIFGNTHIALTCLDGFPFPAVGFSTQGTTLVLSQPTKALPSSNKPFSAVTAAALSCTQMAEVSVEHSCCICLNYLLNIEIVVTSLIQYSNYNYPAFISLPVKFILTCRFCSK